MEQTVKEAGDMLKSAYDTDNDGKVNKADDADKLGGQSPEYFAKATDIPGKLDITHNTDETAHSDIRTQINSLDDEVVVIKQQLEDGTAGIDDIVSTAPFGVVVRLCTTTNDYNNKHSTVYIGEENNPPTDPDIKLWFKIIKPILTMPVTDTFFHFDANSLHLDGARSSLWEDPCLGLMVLGCYYTSQTNANSLTKNWIKCRAYSLPPFIKILALVDTQLVDNTSFTFRPNKMVQPFL